MEFDFYYALRTQEKKHPMADRELTVSIYYGTGPSVINVSARVKRAEIRRDPSRTRGITEIVRALRNCNCTRAFGNFARAHPRLVCNTDPNQMEPNLIVSIVFSTILK